METLEVARRERGRLMNEVARLDKVIALLTGQEERPPAPPKRRGRKHTPEQRQKMKDAWARRKQAKEAGPNAHESELAHG